MRTSRNTAEACARARIVLISACVAFISCGEADAPNDMVEDGASEDAIAVGLPGLPADIAGYEQWLKMNVAPIPPRPADPHDGHKDVYVNQERAVIAPGGVQRFPYPDGTMIVKEAVRPDKDFIGLVAIMRKAKGTNPSHDDWAFEEYSRRAADAEFGLIADGAVCENCHARAASTDYCYTVLE